MLDSGNEQNSELQRFAREQLPFPEDYELGSPRSDKSNEVPMIGEVNFKHATIAEFKHLNEKSESGKQSNGPNTGRCSSVGVIGPRLNSQIEE